MPYVDWISLRIRRKIGRRPQRLSYRIKTENPEHRTSQMRGKPVKDPLDLQPPQTLLLQTFILVVSIP